MKLGALEQHPKPTFACSLGDYGGATQTMPLLPASLGLGTGAAFDDASGNPILADQRGFQLPTTSAPDIGAFQTQSLASTGQAAIYVNTLQDDPLTAGQMSFADATNLANAFGGDQPITFDRSLVTGSGGSLWLGGYLSVGSYDSINEGSGDTLTLASAPSLDISSWSETWTDQNGNQIGSVHTSTGETSTDTFNDAESAELIATVTAYDSSGNYIELPAVYAIVTPAAPSGLTASTFSQNQINLSWTNNSTMATQFEILISTDGSHFGPFDAVPISNTTYQAVGLAPDTQYYFEVAATDTTISVSAASSPAQSTTNFDPWDVQDSGNADTVAEGGTYNLSLSATPVASAPTFGYWTINWGDGSDNDTVYSTDTTVSHAFAAGTEFSVIQISASTADGAATPLTVNAPPIIVIVIPTAPSMPTVAVKSEEEIDLNWTDSSQIAAGYNILRSDNGGPFNLIDTVDSDATSYNDTSLSPSDTAEYEVQAFSDLPDDNSSSTASASVMTPSGIPSFGVTLGAAGSQSAVLSWSYQGNDATYFEVEMEDQTAGGNFQAVLLPGAVNSNDPVTTTYGGLTGGDTYLFRIRADHNDGSVSDWVQGGPITIPQAAAPTVDVSTVMVGPTGYQTPELRVGWSGVTSGAFKLEVQSDALPGGSQWYTILFSTNDDGTWPTDFHGDEGGWDYNNTYGNSDQGYILNPEVFGSGTYTYRIQGADAYGNATKWSNAASGTYTSPFAEPQPVTPRLTATSTSITASWPASAYSPAGSLLVEQDDVDGTVGGDWGVPLTPAPQLNSDGTMYVATISNLTPGTTYDFDLWTPPLDYNEYAACAFAKTSITTTGTPPLSAPNAPSNAVANWGVPNEAGVFLHWVDNSDDETGFWVYRSEGGSAFNAATAVPIASLSTDATTFDDPNSDPDQNNYYDVFAYDGPAMDAPATAPTTQNTQPTTHPTSQPTVAQANSLTIHVSAGPLGGYFEGPFWNRLVAGLVAGLDLDDFQARDFCEQYLTRMASLDPQLLSYLRSIRQQPGLTPEQQQRLDSTLKNTASDLVVTITQTDPSVATVTTSLFDKSTFDWRESYDDMGNGNIDFDEKLIDPNNGVPSEYLIDAGTTQGGTFKFTAEVPSVSNGLRKQYAQVAIKMSHLDYDAFGNIKLDKDGNEIRVIETVVLYVWVTK